jgi:hypothetical protein
VNERLGPSHPVVRFPAEAETEACHSPVIRPTCIVVACGGDPCSDSGHSRTPPAAARILQHRALKIAAHDWETSPGVSHHSPQAACPPDPWWSHVETGCFEREDIAGVTRQKQRVTAERDRRWRLITGV